MKIYLVTVVISIIISGGIVAVFLPKLLFFSLKKRLIDPIDSRKIHNSLASRLGGVSFYPAILVSIVFSNILVAYLQGKELVFEAHILVDMVAILLLYFLGIYDDLIGVKYRVKFFIQILASLLVIASGTYIQSLYVFDTIYEFPMYLSVALTMLVIVFITNAINLIDGINGLASMLAILAFSVLGMIFFLIKDYYYFIVSFATVGALLPFWFHNVFGLRKNIKARIFMGDCGSLVIGFMLSLMVIKAWNISADTHNYLSNDICHILAYTVLFVPCIDVVRVVLHRYKNRKSLFLPDKNHIHHKFMALGCSSGKTLVIVIGLQLFFIAINLLLSPIINMLYILAIDVVIWTVMHIIITKKIISKIS